MSFFGNSYLVLLTLLSLWYLFSEVAFSATSLTCLRCPALVSLLEFLSLNFYAMSEFLCQSHRVNIPQVAYAPPAFLSLRTAQGPAAYY